MFRGRCGSPDESGRRQGGIFRPGAPVVHSSAARRSTAAPSGELLRSKPDSRFYVTDAKFLTFTLISADQAAFLHEHFPDVLLVESLGVYNMSGQYFGGIDGSSKDNREPSWKAFWERETGQTFSTCASYEFGNAAQYGGHTYYLKCGGRWFITPICPKHNAKKYDGNDKMVAQAGVLAVEIAPLFKSTAKALEALGCSIPMGMRRVDPILRLPVEEDDAGQFQHRFHRAGLIHDRRGRGKDWAGQPKPRPRFL